MKQLESSEAPFSSLELTPNATKPSSQGNSGDASVEFWQSIQTMMRLQNQAPPLHPVSRDEKLPLSFPEERLWLLDQLQPGNLAQNLPFTFRLTGTLNRDALQRSLLELLERHESLRSCFIEVEGQPARAIATATASLNFEVIDLRPLPKAEQEQQVQQVIQQEVDRPFNLKAGQLLRVRLLQLGEQEHLLLLLVHHIVFDGWSEGVLFRDLAELYGAFSSNQAPSLPALPIQYADFATWQRQCLQAEMQHTLLSYWQRQLEHGLPAQPLPAARRHPVTFTRRSARQSFRLNSELTQALKKLSRQERTTLFVTLLAAFKVVLHRYTGQSDLFVCTPTANRTRNELKNLIGYFINLLILRTDVSGDPSFQELMGRVRQVVSGANAHQDLPFQQVVEQLELGGAPLTQILFVFQNYPQQMPQFAGLQVEALELDSSTTDFDLFLSLTEEAGQLRGVLKYNTDRLEDGAIAQLLTDYQQVLEAVVAHPEAVLSSPNLLAKEQRHTAEIDSLDGVEQVYIPPRDKVESQLVEIWQQLLGVVSVGVQDNFFNLGGHSILALQLFTQIKQVFGKDLPLSTLYQAPTVEQLATVLRQDNHSVSWSSLVPIQPDGSKPILFCIHPAKGNILGYERLAHYLGIEQPIYGLQARGLDGKQAPLNRVEMMAACYIQEIRTLQPKGPYYLAGHSLGGTISFEIAQQLQAQGEKVALVAMFDTYAHRVVTDMTRQSALSLTAKIRLHLKRLFQFDLREKIRYFLERSTKRIQKTAVKIYQRLGVPLPYPLRSYAVAEAGLEAARRYVPQLYSGRIVLFRVDGFGNESALGWDGLALGGVEVHHVPGTHCNLLKEPHVQIVAKQFKACLEEAQMPEMSRTETFA